VLVVPDHNGHIVCCDADGVIHSDRVIFNLLGRGAQPKHASKQQRAQSYTTHFYVKGRSHINLLLLTIIHFILYNKKFRMHRGLDSFGGFDQFFWSNAQNKALALQGLYASHAPYDSV
jgi:hypothetical protein